MTSIDTLAQLLSAFGKRLTSLERRLIFIPSTPDPPAPGLLADPGDVKMTARSTAPPGWLLCQGQSLPRASYAELFAAIGTAYGSVDGASFSLPDLRGRVPVGLDAAQAEFDTLGEAGGAKTHALTIPQMPAHTHNVLNIGGGAFPEGSGVTGYYPSGATAATSSTGGGEAHPNLQPYRVLQFIIKT